MYFDGFAASVCLTIPGLSQSNFQQPKVSGFLLHFDVCAFIIICACSFTVLHDLDILAHFNFFFFSLNSWFSVMGPWVGAGCGE